MKKRKYMTIALSGVVLALSVLAFARPTTSTNILSANPTPFQQIRTIQRELARREVPVPDHVMYGLFLRYVSVLKKQAIKNERLGKDGSGLRSTYKHKADLSDNEAYMLEQIATECEQEVAQQDARAKVVIDAFRARYPNGIVPPGETLPPPPLELQVMKKERDAIVLRARDRLRAAFGEQEFMRFDQFIRSEVAPEIQHVKPRQQPPNGNIDNR
ncbi:MAG TPA: hypothetical protein VF553_00590 [Pyrinomonadaceae bacterium]|jgi:hypothetical protein